MLAARVEKFSDAVTLILRAEAAAKVKMLVYVFINVRQVSPTSFTYTVDDSRDKISGNALASIKVKFEEIFGPVG
jgi:nitrate reductase assembly molybdenum cofactor insertion protein NarJ